MITINGKNIYSEYGLLFQSISGILDMPKRKGLISRDWGTSIEPFLDANDIEFEGRNIELQCIGEIPDILFSGQIELSTPWGSSICYCQDEIKYKERQLIIPLYEPSWIQPAISVTASGGTGFIIDGFNLYKDFGMIISEITDYKNIANRINVETTDYYKKVWFRSESVINISGVFEANSRSILQNISSFFALISSSGVKTLSVPGMESIHVYSSDGCKITNIRDNYASFSITLRQIKTDNINSLMSETGEMITSETGEMITSETLETSI